MLKTISAFDRIGEENAFAVLARATELAAQGRDVIHVGIGEPGCDMFYPDPAFPIYRSMIEFTGARPVPVPIREENNFAFSADETLSLITPQTRLIIVNSPANPTGGVTPKREVDKLIAGLERYPDIAIMSDEIYDHMLYHGGTDV